MSYISFQTSGSSITEEIYLLHNYVLLILLCIAFVVFFIMTYICIRFNANMNPIPAKFASNVFVEFCYITASFFILIIIAIPSFKILNSIEKIPKSDLTIKVVANQWYWHYIYLDYDFLAFDSYIIEDIHLKSYQKRLLEVDNPIVVPEGSIIKFIVTASDVIHSFAIPSLGIKIDAIPGRINETWTKANKKGIYYGQCYELCGVNHGFMPIMVKVVTKEGFKKWLEEMQTHIIK